MWLRILLLTKLEVNDEQTYTFYCSAVNQFQSDGIRAGLLWIRNPSIMSPLLRALNPGGKVRSWLSL